MTSNWRRRLVANSNHGKRSLLDTTVTLPEATWQMTLNVMRLLADEVEKQRALLREATTEIQLSSATIRSQTEELNNLRAAARGIRAGCPLCLDRGIVREMTLEPTRARVMPAGFRTFVWICPADDCSCRVTVEE